MSDEMEPFDNIFIPDTLEIVTLRPGDDRIGNLMDFGRRQNEFDVLRRFFQCFQESIESSFGKHMHLVYDIDFVWRLRRLELGPLDHITDIVDSRIGSGIDLDDVQETSVLRIETILTCATRIPIVCERKAVHSFCKDACHRRFPCSTGSMEKISTDGTVLQKGILQNLPDKGLSEKGMEVFWSICLIKRHPFGKNEK